MTFKSEILLCQEEVKISTHSDGAVSIKIPKLFAPEWSNTNNWVIYANIKDPSGMLALIYLLDHLNTNANFDGISFVLDLTYLPNARQDRVTGDNDFETPNTVKTFCNLLAGYKRLTTVYASDVHSNVPSVLLNNLAEQSHLHSYIVAVPLEVTDTIDYFISPDLGAYKKVKSISQNYDTPYLVAQKERDPISHEIELSLTYDVDLTGKTVMICDDICDGGRTFLAVSKILKETYKAKTVYLYITHGIFPFGYDHLKQYIDKIYVNSCWLKKEEVENSTFIQTFQYF